MLEQGLHCLLVWAENCMTVPIRSLKVLNAPLVKVMEERKSK